MVENLKSRQALKPKQRPLNKNFPQFITFEGGEGAGKTTLIQRLKKFLQNQGHEVLVTREPGGTDLGEAVRDLLLHSKNSMVSSKAELLLFLAARAEHVDEIILPALAQGKIVLCDRYNDSTVAYQGIARKLGLQKVRALCGYATNHLNPDMTFYLDVPPEIGLSRALKAEKSDAIKGKPDRIEALEISFHHLVRKAFLKVAHKEPRRIQILDASLTSDQVFEKLLDSLSKYKKI